MFAEIQHIMVRVTNLNFRLGWKVSQAVISDSNYVVLESLKRPTQAAITSGLLIEKPNASNWRELMELGIPQYLEKWGERRDYITTGVCRKDSSFAWLIVHEFL